MARCKFKCRSKTEFDEGFSDLHMEITKDESEENIAFFKHSPNGHLNLSFIKKEIADQIKVGNEYFIDITPVESEE